MPQRLVRAQFHRKEKKAVALLRRVLPPHLGRRRRRRPVIPRHRRGLDTKQTAKSQPMTRGVDRLLHRRYLMRVSPSREMVRQGPLQRQHKRHQKRNL